MPSVRTMPGYEQPEERCPKTDRLIYPSEAQADAARITQDQVRHTGAGAPLVVEQCGAHWHLTKARTKRARTKPKAKRRNRGRGVERPHFDAQEWDEATMLLWQRCRDKCERCGDPLNGDMARHHRQRRAVGGDRLSNLLALHTHCHVMTHESPAQSRAAGLIVSSYEPDSATVPVTLPDGRRWLLDDRGGKRPAA